MGGRSAADCWTDEPDAAGCCARADPHFPQNCAPGETFLPHCGQTLARELPQRSQNLLSASFSLPQVEQRTSVLPGLAEGYRYWSQTAIKTALITTATAKATARPCCPAAYRAMAAVPNTITFRPFRRDSMLGPFGT